MEFLCLSCRIVKFRFFESFRKWMTIGQLYEKISKVFWVFRGSKELFLRIKNFWWAMKKVEFSSAAVGSNFMLTLEIAQYFCCGRSLYFSLNHLFFTCTKCQFYDWKVFCWPQLTRRKTTAVNVHSSLGLFSVKLNLFRNRITFLTLLFVIPKKEREMCICTQLDFKVDFIKGL